MHGGVRIGKRYLFRVFQFQNTSTRHPNRMGGVRVHESMKVSLVSEFRKLVTLYERSLRKLGTARVRDKPKGNDKKRQSVLSAPVSLAPDVLKLE